MQRCLYNNNRTTCKTSVEDEDVRNVVSIKHERRASQSLPKNSVYMVNVVHHVCLVFYLPIYFSWFVFSSSSELVLLPLLMLLSSSECLCLSNIQHALQLVVKFEKKTEINRRKKCQNIRAASSNKKCYTEKASIQHTNPLESNTVSNAQKTTLWILKSCQLNSISFKNVTPWRFQCMKIISTKYIYKIIHKTKVEKESEHWTT